MKLIQKINQTLKLFHYKLFQHSSTRIKYSPKEQVVRSKPAAINDTDNGRRRWIRGPLVVKQDALLMGWVMMMERGDWNKKNELNTFLKRAGSFSRYVFHTVTSPNITQKTETWLSKPKHRASSTRILFKTPRRTSHSPYHLSLKQGNPRPTYLGPISLVLGAAYQPSLYYSRHVISLVFGIQHNLI